MHQKLDIGENGGRNCNASKCTFENASAMSLNRLKGIKTNDLLNLTALQAVYEITLSLPWLVMEIFFLHQGQITPALLCAFYFFLTGLRQVHGGYHLTLGLSKKATDRFLFLMSLVMLGSMHAIKFNHLRHHRYSLSSDDIEATSAHMRWWKAILIGPAFPLLLHRHALRNANETYRAWIRVELAGNILVSLLGALLAVLQATPILLLHVSLMSAGQCFTAFFAVWTVHRNCDPSGAFARTQNGRLKNFISYNMFLHLEHHLFPQVPQINLPLLAARLQEIAPELRTRLVF